MKLVGQFIRSDIHTGDQFKDMVRLQIDISKHFRGSIKVFSLKENRLCEFHLRYEGLYEIRALRGHDDYAMKYCPHVKPKPSLKGTRDPSPHFPKPDVNSEAGPTERVVKALDKAQTDLALFGMASTHMPSILGIPPGLKSKRRHHGPKRSIMRKDVPQSRPWFLRTIGDLVLHGTKVVAKSNEYEKLSANWEGPYVVTKQVYPGTNLLTTLQGRSIPQTWHSVNLRKYYT
ncbi:hypothetical protein Cgig2_015873 [Carnegiea gigantea]|uniref:Uncharacterized protein n=1 Tax=Carnegiea gigantea TaxID=171969 RepID=A0A9Q1GGR4_9CARY|nr:hypothetical protein Cgig2_015873 [Carnegiea gigantea]